MSRKRKLILALSATWTIISVLLALHVRMAYVLIIGAIPAIVYSILTAPEDIRFWTQSRKDKP